MHYDILLPPENESEYKQELQHIRIFNGCEVRFGILPKNS